MAKTDVLIVGGGAVGSVIAKGLLSHTSHSVSLVEPSAYTVEGNHPGFDDRVIALAKRTVDELAGLGVETAHAGGIPIHHIQVSDKGAAGLCRLSAEDHRIDRFGDVVSLRRLGDALKTESNNKRFSLYNPASVTSVERHSEQVAVTLNTGEVCEAKLLILADGGRSPLHHGLGFERDTDDYGQTAIIVNVATSEPHNNRAYERFTAYGPLAFLPFESVEDDTHKKGGFSVVWTVPPDVATTFMAMSESAFIRALQHEFGWRQGSIVKMGKRTAYPLALSVVRNTVTHRAVVVGNAAQTLHPIAGQGFNLGLRDAMALVKQLAEADDPGAFNVLRRYAASRANDKQATVTLTDGLVRLFSNAMPGLIAARNVGLVAMDNSSTLQQLFVRQTTGFAPGA